MEITGNFNEKCSFRIFARNWRCLGSLLVEFVDVDCCVDCGVNGWRLAGSSFNNQQFRSKRSNVAGLKTTRF